jgi:hypothetical protein
LALRRLAVGQSGPTKPHNLSSLNHSNSKVSIMERLDELSKHLATSVSRRESLRSIGAVLAGVALNSLGVGTAWGARPDRCTAFCRSCPTKRRRDQCIAACRACNGNMNRLCGSCGNYVCCATGTSCLNGTCSPPGGCYGGLLLCDGFCRDIQANPSHCGGCGIQCGGGQYCAGGHCQDAEAPSNYGR